MINFDDKFHFFNNLSNLFNDLIIFELKYLHFQE